MAKAIHLAPRVKVEPPRVVWCCWCELRAHFARVCAPFISNTPIISRCVADVMIFDSDGGVCVLCCLCVPRALAVHPLFSCRIEDGYYT